MTKRPTLKDIAQETGVSTASVSMILNGKSLNRFRPELVSRVLDSARRMHYATPSARSAPQTVAIISPSVNNPYHTTIIMGIERAARANGYLTSISNTYWDPRIELEILRQLESRRVAGIIYVMNPLQGERARELSRYLPVVAVGDAVDGLGLDMVDVNNFKAAQAVAEHLIGLGHEHIAYLTTSLNAQHLARVRRLEGLQESYRRLCPQGSVTVYCRDNKMEQEIQSAELELDSGRMLAAECVKNPRITAIVAINDMVGYGVLDALLERGLRVPEDYSLCGFDNIFPSGFQRMGLTTVDHSTVHHGARAFHLLKEKLEDDGSREEALPITRVEYESRLILRHSTAAPRHAR